MTDVAFTESDMVFGPFPAGHCFRIEKSATYLAIQDGVKIAEFVLLDTAKNPPVVRFVEAKSSSPNPANHGDFHQFLIEIEEKFRNTLCLAVACVLERHLATYSELPAPFRNFDPRAVQFHFLLVMRGHKKEWLPQLQDAIEKQLRAIVRIWGAPKSKVLVINDDIARNSGLIQ